MKFKMKIPSTSRERRPTSESIQSASSLGVTSVAPVSSSSASASSSSSSAVSNSFVNSSVMAGRNSLTSGSHRSISPNIIGGNAGGIGSGGRQSLGTIVTTDNKMRFNSISPSPSPNNLKNNNNSSTPDIEKRRSCGLLSSLKLGVEQSRAFSIDTDDTTTNNQQQTPAPTPTPVSSTPNSLRPSDVTTNHNHNAQTLSSSTNSNTLNENDSNHRLQQRPRSRSRSSSRQAGSSGGGAAAQRRRQFGQKAAANLDCVHVVVGNEACDLDSAVSCLLMFHILNKTSAECPNNSPTTSCTSSSAAVIHHNSNSSPQPRTLYIPLLNVERRQLDTKTEVLWYLKKTLNIDKSHLTCKDDIDWDEIKKMGVEILVTLVDHNHNEEFSKLGKIIEIIDHHQIQNCEQFLANHTSVRLTLDPTVGSCSTLLAERLLYTYAEHHVADEILMLIYGTVLLDTICLSERARRFNRRDVYLLNKIDSLLGPHKRPSRQDLYKSLVEIKNCTSKEMNFESLMTRDLKIFREMTPLPTNETNPPQALTPEQALKSSADGQVRRSSVNPNNHSGIGDQIRVAVASLFGVAAQEALGLAAANVDLDAFFDTHKCQGFVIMGLIMDLANPDSISRDLVVITRHRRLFEVLTSALESPEQKLELSVIKTNPEDHPDHKHFSITFDDDISDDDDDENENEDNDDLDSISVHSLSISAGVGTIETNNTEWNSSTGNNNNQQSHLSDVMTAQRPTQSPSAHSARSGRSVVRQSHFWARLYQQKNVTASRKVVAPIVVRVLNERAYRYDHVDNVSNSHEHQNPSLNSNSNQAAQTDDSGVGPETLTNSSSISNNNNTLQLKESIVSGQNNEEVADTLI